MALHTVTQIHIQKSDLHETKIYQESFNDIDLETGQLLLRVVRFGFSANNVTYAALGDKMGYWGFFPAKFAADVVLDDQQFGILPVWGFAEVVASKHSDIKIGKRVYGYLPFASHVIVTADSVKKTGFVDVNPSRKSIHKVYDQYLFVDNDLAYDASREVWQMNFRPLFMTSFVLGMHVRDNCNEGQVLMSSAASKTALGAASYLRSLKHREFKVIGLTSPSNLSFVEDTGFYDNVLSYHALPELDANSTTWLLDFAANGNLHDQLHAHLSTNFIKTSLIGATDWSAENKPSMKTLNSSVFFAPSEVQQRLSVMGQADFMHAYATAWKNFARIAGSFMSENQFEGIEQLLELYDKALENKLDTTTLVDASF